MQTTLNKTKLTESFKLTFQEFHVFMLSNFNSKSGLAGRTYLVLFI